MEKTYKIGELDIIRDIPVELEVATNKNQKLSNSIIWVVIIASMIIGGIIINYKKRIKENEPI